LAADGPKEVATWLEHVQVVGVGGGWRLGGEWSANDALRKPGRPGGRFARVHERHFGRPASVCSVSSGSSAALEAVPAVVGKAPHVKASPWRRATGARAAQIAYFHPSTRLDSTPLDWPTVGCHANSSKRGGGPLCMAVCTSLSGLHLCARLCPRVTPPPLQGPFNMAPCFQFAAAGCWKELLLLGTRSQWRVPLPFGPHLAHLPKRAH